MSKTIKFKTGGGITRSFFHGRFVFRVWDDGVGDGADISPDRNEILDVVNLLLSTPTTDITPVDRCPQCNGPIDTEQSVTMLLGEGGPKIIACHGCTVVNAKRNPATARTQIFVPHTRMSSGQQWRCDICGAAPGEPCK